MSEPSVPPPPPYYTPPPPPTGPTSGAVSPNRGIMIVLSYLWLLALIPLLTEKDDKEVQWHAKHGLVLLGAEVIVWVAFLFLHMVLIAIHIGFLGCFLSIIQLVLWLGILVLHIVCIIKGTKGERFLIPGISQYADRF
ncbi:MAG TPA: DUF4870 domain-containing protein [Thermoanaerobaculia bacterium]|jgi:uncharacterized membrane protein|nr:DUF4870 domain-containing protein [Thermoanaerobaculia bacterium]